MDPISVVGVASASVQIAQCIAQIIQGLCTLRGKFKDADMTIRLLIAELSTIRAAVSQLRDWAEWNSSDSPKETEYLKGLEVALEGCQAAMDVLAEEIKELVVEFTSSGDATTFSLGFMGRARAVWSEDTMKTHQDRLHAQVQALNLLLQASHCRSSTAQLELLRLKENRRIIQKVSDDTTTLRESMSVANSRAGSTIHGNRQSTIGCTVFDFDQRLVTTAPYRRAMASLPPLDTNQNTQKAQYSQRMALGTGAAKNDEGYQSMGDSRSATPTTPLTGNQPFASLAGLGHSLRQEHIGTNARDLFKIRSRSSSHSPTSLRGPAIHQRLSPSSPSSPSSLLIPSPSSQSSPVDKFSDLRKKKFWPGLCRLSTLSTSNLKARSNRVNAMTPTYNPRHRGMRGQETNLNQSIDFSTADGLDTPALVRAAQAGSRMEVERLVDNGNDIEAFHGPTRRTALAVAAHCGNSEVVAALIHLNANLTPRDQTLATPLHLSASRGHMRVLETLLNEGVPLEETNENKATALWLAVHRGHVEAAELLLQKGAKVNTRAESQLTPLHIASQSGDAEMVELLLCHGGHVESRDIQFMAALHYACAKGHQAVVDVLLDRGASIEAMGADGRSPLICATAEGHRQVVELLLRKKASPRSKDERENNALHWAAYYGHVDVADILLHKKLPINDKNADGLTPLHLAVIGSRFSAVEFLLRMNAMLEPQCLHSRTPMHYACGSDNADIVRLLLGAGAQLESPVAGDLRKPIHIAASTGNVEIIQLLCEKGVAIDSRDSAGDRPLCIAAYYGHAKVVQKLLDSGAPLRLPFGDRSYEDSPLCVAAKGGHLGVVSVLLRKGASVRQKDELGWQPIRYAAHYGHPSVLELLLGQASTLSDDTTGLSPSDYGGDYIGFASGSNISQESKRRVRELLSQAERQARASMTESVIQSATPGCPGQSGSQAVELDVGYPGRNQALLSHSQEMSATMTGGPLYCDIPDFVPRPSDTASPKYKLYSLEDINDAKIGPSTLRQSSTTAANDTPTISQPPAVNTLPSYSNWPYKQPWRPTVSPEMSYPSRLSPEEAALLIEDRRNEIAQLQLFLPSIDEGTVHDVRRYFAPTSVAYELPS